MPLAPHLLSAGLIFVLKIRSFQLVCIREHARRKTIPKSIVRGEKKFRSAFLAAEVTR